MHSGRKVGLGLVLTLLLAVFMVSPVGAVAVKSGDMLTIEEGKTTGPLLQLMPMLMAMCLWQLNRSLSMERLTGM